MRHYKILILVLLALIFLFPAAAHANAGLPLVVGINIFMILALIPIIAVETALISLFSGLPLWASLKVASVVNGISTFIGILASYPFLSFVDYIFDEESEYEPWEESSAIAAMLAMLIIFFFASWLIEHHYACQIFKSLDPQSIKHGLFMANLVSYVGLGAFFLLLFFKDKAEQTEDVKVWGSDFEGEEVEPQVVEKSYYPGEREIDEHTSPGMIEIETGKAFADRKVQDQEGILHHISESPIISYEDILSLVFYWIID